MSDLIPEPIPYPKWITAPDGQPCIVPNAWTEAAVLAGEVVIPDPPKSALNEHLRIVPSLPPPAHATTEPE